MKYLFLLFISGLAMSCGAYGNGYHRSYVISHEDEILGMVAPEENGSDQ